MTPRRHAIKTAALMLAGLSPWSSSFAATEAAFYPAVKPRRLVFPRDHGAHPAYRTEWWYLTGWLGQGPSAIGFQLTFFRSRTQHAVDNPSRLAPTQLLFAHAAMSVAKQDVFLHANRAGRLSGTALRAETADTDLQFEDWHLRRVQRAAAEVYEGHFSGEGFALSFEASTQQAVILRGQEGWSQKGPEALQASHYYSRAPLRVNAQMQLGQQSQKLEGKAWLDHEWSSQLLMPGAVGWDWLGINLLDGGTLMAFQIRNQKSEPLYAHVDARDREGLSTQAWNGLTWHARGSWRSKALIDYPIPMDLVVGGQSFRLVPLMLAQEVDARASTGGFYWEGAVSLMQADRLLGHGYLELTGYGAPLRI
ncbi:lipocalin-like domain-containing protein [uncultured Limnohabitans sp.]|uniref:lipocalin-like domain-containing protein n=1 Tax=uncultured Limnohabitans sp. TaxID=768543 RepID=UPI00260E71DB|nr:lipocalin-like domain-containing protein [uncultured Limnohabitans sp.]